MHNRRNILSFIQKKVSSIGDDILSQAIKDLLEGERERDLDLFLYFSFDRERDLRL